VDRRQRQMCIRDSPKTPKPAKLNYYKGLRDTSNFLTFSLHKL
jgi:hypothetical protein